MYQVQIYENLSCEEFKAVVAVKREPCIIKGYDVGSCMDKWSMEYLAEKVGDTPVKIHVSSENKMNFISKNFLYKTIPFNKLLNRISQNEQNDYFIHENEYYYLRSLGTDARGKDVANFNVQYPELSEDLKVPEYFSKDDLFSSVLRISSGDVSLWTHYDIMDNILIQIKGKKRMVLWPPSEALNMYLVGDKSAVIEIDNPDTTTFPNFQKAKRYECTLEPGNILFIPALWFHNAHALEPGIAVNVFWKHLSSDYYDKKDAYGNKDLIAGAKALQFVENGMKAVSVLPPVYKDFYIRRMIATLENKLL